MIDIRVIFLVMIFQHVMHVVSREGFPNPSLPDRREDGGGRERKKKPPELVLTHHQVVKIVFIKF